MSTPVEREFGKTDADAREIDVSVTKRPFLLCQQNWEKKTKNVIV